jgi:phosphoribosylformylglycinamidine synthase subunit PurQ / glutaminase
MTSCRALVLCGDGINCDIETAFALELAGFTADRIHCSDLLADPQRLFSYKLLALPGGFSFGDEIASGKVLAVKLKERLKNILYDFTERGNLVIGICNGFQILVQLGLLPDSSEVSPRLVSLCHNSSGRFMNKWVSLEVSANPGPLLAGLEVVHLPIRHGEGRLALADDAGSQTVEHVKSAAPLRYSADVNGSFDRIAALCNSKSTVMGLMPHPEAFVRWNQHPCHKSKHAATAGEDILPLLDESGVPHGLRILSNAAAMVK